MSQSERVHTGQVAERVFVVAYKGPAVDSGSMDVRQLAPALLALGELFQETQRVLYPNDTPMSLEVRATEQGSFEVHLALTQSLWQQAVSLFAGDTPTAIANVLSIGGGVIYLLAKLTKSVRRQTVTAPGQITIEFGDGTTITIPADVLRAAENMTIRQAASEIVEPVRHDGIDSVEFARLPNQVEPIRVTKNELAAFDLPNAPEDKITDAEQVEVVSLASVAFNDGNKWRLTDGERTFHAAIQDQQFIQRVAADDIRFAKHDMLRVRVRTEQWRTDSGLKTQHTVTEVLEHIPAARAVPLPFARADDATAEIERPSLPPEDPAT